MPRSRSKNGVQTAADAAYAALTQRLHTLASPARAEKEKSYQKSPWTHWGVALPDMDRALRETVPDLDEAGFLMLAERLWREPVWDLKLIATRLLTRDAMPPDAALWDFVLTRMPELDGWAIADGLAKVGARCLLADPERLDALDAWVRSPHLWTRRAAFVFTLPWTQPGRDPERMLAWADRLADDREWFIQKAIGWWLRALSRHDPARVKRFLREHGARLKGVAKREAEKYL